MNDKWLLWAPRVVLGVSLLLAASATAKLTGTLLMPEVRVPAEQTSGSRGGVTAAVADHAGRIQEAKLMGEAPKVVAPRAAKVPETRLNLKLIGVLATGTESGMAIIADGRGEEKLYMVGKRLPGGAVLREVLIDRVLLEGPTGLETLRLYDPALSSGPMGARDLSDSSTSTGRSAGLYSAGVQRFRDSRAARLRAANAAGRAGMSVNSSRFGLPGARSSSIFPGRTGSSAGSLQTAQPASLAQGSDLAALRDELISNPSLLSGVVTTREVRRDGEVVGYALDFHRDDPIIAELGLQSGDVVTQVNGIPLNSPVQGLKVVNALTTAPAVTATIERDGRTIRLSRSLR